MDDQIVLTPNGIYLPRAQYGKYYIGGRIWLYHPSTMYDTVLRKAALTHEALHLAVMGRTPFGLVQRLLGYLSTLRTASKYLRGLSNITMRHTLASSFDAHETLATAEEALHARTYGFEEFKRCIHAIPDHLWLEVKPILELVSAVEVPNGLDEAINRALAYCVFATAALEDFRSPEEGLRRDHGVYFSDPDKSPNKRLNMLRDAEMRELVPKIVTAAVREYLCSRFKQASLSEIVRQIYDHKERTKVNYLGAVSATAVDSLVSALPFTVVSRKVVAHLYAELTKEWSVYLADRGIRFPKKLLFTVPYSSTTADKLSEQVDFRIRPDVVARFLQRAVRITSLAQLRCHFDNDVGAHTYCGLRSDRPSAAIVDSNVAARVGKNQALLLLHKYTLTREEGAPTTPAQGTSVLVRHDPYAYSVAVERLHEVFAHLRPLHIACTIQETMFRHITRTRGEEFLPQNVPPPVVVITRSSRYDHWKRILDELRSHGKLYSWHTRNIRVTDLNWDSCIIALQDGSHVFLRPTDLGVYNRLLNQYQGLSELSNWSDFERLFSAEWATRLSVCCEHYYRFGV